MLRASSESHSETVDLSAIMSGEVDSGIEHGAELVGFAETVVAREPAAIESARRQLLDAAGAPAMLDAAGVVSNFQRMVRIANATGIGLGHAQQSTADLRASLGIDRFRHDDAETD